MHVMHALGTYIERALLPVRPRGALPAVILKVGPGRRGAAEEGAGVLEHVGRLHDEPAASLDRGERAVRLLRVQIEREAEHTLQ